MQFGMEKVTPRTPQSGVLPLLFLLRQRQATSSPSPLRPALRPRSASPCRPLPRRRMSSPCFSPSRCLPGLSICLTHDGVALRDAVGRRDGIWPWPQGALEHGGLMGSCGGSLQWVTGGPSPTCDCYFGLARPEIGMWACA